MKIWNFLFLLLVNVLEMKVYNMGIFYRYLSCCFLISFMFFIGDFNFYLIVWGLGEYILKNSY